MGVDMGPGARRMLAGAGLAFAVVMFALGAWLLCSGLSGVRTGDGRASAEARVADVRGRTVGTGGDAVVVRDLVLSFADGNGREHEVTVGADAVSDSGVEPRVGKTVTVTYDPERPEERVTVSGKGLWARAFPGIACFVMSVAVAVSSASFACGGGDGRGGMYVP